MLGVLAALADLPPGWRAASLVLLLATRADRPGLRPTSGWRSNGRQSRPTSRGPGGPSLAAPLSRRPAGWPRRLRASPLSLASGRAGPAVLGWPAGGSRRWAAVILLGCALLIARPVGRAAVRAAAGPGREAQPRCLPGRAAAGRHRARVVQAPE